MIRVELLAVPGCARCRPQQSALAAVVAEAGPRFAWRQVDVLQEIDHAVSLGVLTLPALAIDGRLVFKSLPTADELRRALASWPET